MKIALLRTAAAATIAVAALTAAGPAFADGKWGVSTSGSSMDNASATATKWGGSVSTSSTSTDTAHVFGTVDDDHPWRSCFDHWTMMDTQAADACDDSFDA
ncbi:hypothetical protein [Streptacidiphilus carbonis]|uniref:hypothetical protein n=1 Tax=Streptacidiphilus carbonis TaxID=105422 RepID=UPI0005AB1FAA|nr:hypothetical protein [Streptacidiphilus carbonis]